jgi:D-alanyl-D-alanine carboxypeptidase (penicillin-binding protein 5/6)
LPWPTQGQAAVAIPSISTTAVASTHQQRAVPIASLAKLMTAYLVLKHLPLAVGSQGPVITISAADEQQYYDDVVQDQSSVQVTAGEHLTEYQLLQALLTRSANNVAQLLATWVAGSEAAFVNQMNQTAARLGLADTHFADASGFSSATRATAKAIATIAAIDMRNPVFDRIVNEHTVTLPLVGTLPNIVARIGTSNVVGIKSGYTIWSGGCAAIATKESTKVGTIEAVAVVLDQQGPASLHHAASIAERLANEASSGVIRTTVARWHQSIGSLRVPWMASTQPASNLMLSHALTANLWPGQRVTYQLHLIDASALIGAAPGSVAGYLQVLWPLHSERINVVTTERIPAPGNWWRLMHA